jgi:antitoxin YefM
MDAVTLKEAQGKLAQIVEQVISNAEPMILVADSGQRAVLISLDEYNAWQETLYLLSSPANAEHLRRSIREADEGRFIAKDPASL